jgi:hypothetical protein
MATDLPLLDQVTIASPCSAPWEKMQGNEQVRFCQQCQENVYNFSEMTRAEAEELIIAKEGKLCGGYYRRQDGTTLTRDCPVGVRQLRTRVIRAFCAVAATLVALVSGVIWGRGAAVPSQTGVEVLDDGPLSKFARWVSPKLRRVEVLGGEICLPRNHDFGSEEKLTLNSTPPENTSSNSTGEP